MDDLHPQTLDILGLPAAIESHLEKVCAGANAPEYHFLSGEGVDGFALSRIIQVTLFRVTVEAIQNVLRHAAASRIEVGISRRNNQLVIAVEDNGVGFDYAPSPPTSKGGRGLHNILERARAIGAQVRWGSSRFSSGTRFEVIMPLAK